MNRKQFLKSIGLFMILPGAGRIWKAESKIILLPFKVDIVYGQMPSSWMNKMIPIFYRRGGWIDSLPGISDYIKSDEDKARILEDDRLVLDLARRGSSVEGNTSVSVSMVAK